MRDKIILSSLLVLLLAVFPFLGKLPDLTHRQALLLAALIVLCACYATAYVFGDRPTWPPPSEN